MSIECVRIKLYSTYIVYTYRCSIHTYICMSLHPFVILEFTETIDPIISTYHKLHILAQYMFTGEYWVSLLGGLIYVQPTTYLTFHFGLC